MSQYTRSIQDGVVIYSISGNFTGPLAREIGDAELENVAVQPAELTVVDLRHAAEIDSSALGVVVGMFKRASLSNGNVRFVCTENGPVRQYLDHLNLTRVLGVHETVDAAIDSGRTRGLGFGWLPWMRARRAGLGSAAGSRVQLSS